VFARDLHPNNRRANGSYDYNDVQSMLFEAWEPPRKPRATTPVLHEVGAYLLGLMLGDGCLTGSNGAAVVCGSREDADAVAELVAEYFECETNVYHHTRAWYVRGVFHTAPYRSPLTSWFDDLYGQDEWRKAGRDKCLPDIALELPDVERVALLRGLWDSDGCVAGPMAYYRSTSSALLAGVARLLASLRIAYYVRPTAIHVLDRTRFAAILGQTWLPGKRVNPRSQENRLPVLSASLCGQLASTMAVTDHITRKIFRRATRHSMTKPLMKSEYTTRIDGFERAYFRSYEELYQGATRPVFIDSIDDAGTDECFDIQMLDQSSPYFIANGTVTHNCYQEQIMQIARDVAGFTMGGADELRKVMGKKQKDKIPYYKTKFLEGAAANGISEKLAEDIFAFIEPFAGYGFNKSHAAAYGWISYQTGYLKANYPLQYFAALMSSVRDKTDKLVEYIDEAKKMGIAVLPPDVNASLVEFAVVGAQIRFGLAAVKGVGEGAVAAILAQRDAGGPFTDLFDLVNRVGTKAANRKVYEALIKCGALDTLPGNRAQLLDALDGALDGAARASRDRELGQASLFGAIEESAPVFAPALRPIAAPTTMEALTWEKETLGIFVSGHPLADVADALVRAGAVPVKELRNVEDDSPVRVAGLVTAVRRTMTKAQAQMLIATIEDMSGSIECVVFPKSYASLQAFFVEDEIVTVNGRLRLRERRGAVPGEETPVEFSISVNDVARFDRHVVPPPPAGWHVTVATRDHVDALAQLLEESPGTVPLVFHISGQAKRSSRGVANAPYVRAQLERIVGAGNVRPGAPAV
jgi:DNA polymerase-3 subunit alpha